MDDPLGAKEVAGITKDFLAPVGGTLSDAWRGLIGDRVSHWRLRNAMKLQVKTNEEAKRLGLALNNDRIPERYAFAWFEEATKQDEPELQSLFARLLVRAAAGEEEAGDRRFIAVLKELTPIDAAVFQRIYSSQPFPGAGHYAETKALGDPGGFAGESWPRDWAVSLLNSFHSGKAELSVERLVTLGCLTNSFKAEGKNNTPAPNVGKIMDDVKLREAIRFHATIRAYISPTLLGKSLAYALRE
jgi:hypothetical protein